MTSIDMVADEPSADELAVKTKAEALARGTKPEDLREIGKLLAESSSATLSRYLAKLLFASGPDGVEVLRDQLDDPAVRPYAIGALRYSHDAAVWESLCIASLAWAGELRARSPLMTRLSYRRRDRRCWALPRDPSGVHGLYRNRQYGFALSLPAEWVSAGERKNAPRGWLVRFLGSWQAAKVGSVEALMAPFAQVDAHFLPSADSSLDGETYVAQMLAHPDRVGRSLMATEDLGLQLEPELLDPPHRVLVRAQPAIAYSTAAGLRVLQRHQLVCEGRAYALTTSAPICDWAALQPMFVEIVQSFTPTKPS